MVTTVVLLEVVALVALVATVIAAAQVETKAMASTSQVFIFFM